MRSVARRTELARLRSLLAEQINVAVVGNSGSGKTSILRALTEESDARAISVPVNPSESGLPNSGLAVLVAALRAVDGGSLAHDLEDALADDEPEAATAEKIVTVMRAAELDEDVLLVIDGADRLDPRSQTVIGYLLRRQTSGRLRFAVSLDGTGPHSPYSGVQTLALGTLELSESIELAQQLCPDLSPEAAYLVARSSEGHTLALEHMLELMNERQRVGTAPLLVPVRSGSAIAGLVDDNLREVPGEAHDILELLAIAPHTAHHQLLQIFPALWDELAELEARDIVVRNGPYLLIRDQLVRSGVFWSTSARQRRMLHTRMEQLCRSTDPAMAAWHVSFVRHQDDTPEALVQHARELAGEGKRDIAVEFAERALVLCPDPAAITDALLRLAEALIVRGNFLFARRYIRLSRRARPDAACRLRAARLALEIDFLETQTISPDNANSWTAGDISTCPVEVVDLQLTLSACHADRREFAEAEERMATAGDVLERTGGSSLNRESVQVMLDGYLGRGDAALKHYFALADTGTTQARLFHAMAVSGNLILTEHYDEARSTIGMLELAMPAPSIFHELTRLLRVELEIRCGNVHRASLYLTEPRQYRTAHPVRADLELILRCWYLLQEGRAVDVEAVEQDLMTLAAESGNRGILTRLSALQGTFLLRHGLPAEALRHLQRCEELGGGSQPNPNLYRHEPELIEALVAVGRREHAVLVLQRFRKRLDRCPSRWGELAALRCDALLATGERSVELFRRALRASRLSDSDHEKARTTAAFAHRLADLGRSAESREQMLTAAWLYRETGDHRRADELLPGMPVSTPALSAMHPLLSQLSEDERTVVELVREGLRNREIAEKVYVSLRTVEIRLTGVYRKFGVRSRTELIARLAGVDSPTA